MKIKSLPSLMMMAVIAFLLVPSMQSCKSSQKASAEKGETLITTYCSGPEYQSDNEYFRANNSAESTSQSMAKKKAMSNARLDLAASIQTQVKAVSDNYVQSVAAGGEIEDVERFESLGREVVNQELNGIRTICEQFTKLDNGRYKCYVAIELAGNEILNGMKNRIGDDEKLKIDFQYEKYKEEFQKEMDNFENR
jgi:hypothetical protein